MDICNNFQPGVVLVFAKIFRPIFAIAFGLGLGLLLIEVLLRLLPGLLPLETHSQLSQKAGWLAAVGLPQFLAEYRALWAEDDFLRERMKPDLDTVIHGNPEYPAWPIKTSSLGGGQAGFRDTLPDGVRPYALVLGDSFGFGVGVAAEETWLEQVETQTGLTFANLSQVGASSLQEARIYQRYGRDLPAQVVFWMFFQNDLKDNLRFAQWLNPDEDVPQAVRLPSQPCTGALHRLLKRYSLAYELLLYWQHTCEYSAMTAAPTYQDDHLSLTFCLDHDICDPQVQAQMLTAGWPLTRRALQDTLALLEPTGATLVILIVPSKEQVYWEQYQQVAALSPGNNIDHMIEPLRRFCAAERLHCLDLTPVLRAEAQQGRQLYFSIDIHWNAAGHGVVAREVEKYLQRENLLP
ncbi:MAG: hypothetical protein DPW09_42100 [Anaerolineae bacterium]|nr:hypothetical protein [Anaerolineae bacterium]